MNEISTGKILVIDDDPQIRKALVLVLSARNYKVTSVSSGEEAIKVQASDPHDLIMLDLTLPGISGFEVCKELRTFTQAPIIILSVKDNETDKISALDFGADDYITKPFNTGELLARVRAHMRRFKPGKSEKTIFESGGLKVDTEAHEVLVNGNEIKLTKTEFLILQYLIANEGKVITYKFLARGVWGDENLCDPQTLRVHIGNLRKKIEADPDRPRIILTEPGVGYRLVTF